MQIDVLITESNAALAFWPQRAESLAVHENEKLERGDAEKLRLRFEAEETWRA